MNFRILSVVLFILFAKSSLGQLDQGNWLVGGSAKLYSYSNNFGSTANSITAKYTEIDISPNVGYFLADRFVLGLRPTFSSFSGRVTSAGGGTTSVQRFWIGPFGRYYFLDSDKTHNILLESSYQFGKYNGRGQKGDLRTFSVLAGPALYFNSSVGIEFLFGYSHRLEEVKNASKDIKNGLQIGIGIQFHLTK